MPYRPTQFHLTVIKSYYKDNSSKPLQDVPENALEENYDSNTIVVDIPQPRRGRGRPKGSQNY